MGLSTIRSDLHAPQYSRTYTSFGAAIPLHTLSASAPDVPVNHLPDGLFVVAEAGDILAYKDAFGVTNTITFTGVTFVGFIRVAASTIEATTTCVSVTALWQVEP